MKPFSKSFAVMAGAVALLSVSVSAFSQGYDGVLAPSPNAAKEKAGTPAPAAGGYEGVIAPISRPDVKKEDKLGYEGLVPGKVAPRVQEKKPAIATPVKPAVQNGIKENKAAGFTPIDRPRQQSTRYIAPPGERKARSSKDLKDLAMMYSYDKNADSIPDSMAKKFKLPAETIAFLNIPRSRRGGMLPLESTMKTSIDTAVLQAQTKKMPREGVIENLKRLRDGLRAKGSVSDGVYKSMGMPEIYVREEREGVEKSIKHVDEALRQLGAL